MLYTLEFLFENVQYWRCTSDLDVMFVDAFVIYANQRKQTVHQVNCPATKGLGNVKDRSLLYDSFWKKELTEMIDK